MAPSRAPPEAPLELPPNWASLWDSQKSMSFFLGEEMKQDIGVYRVYVVNKDTLKLYHVTDFLDTCPNLGRVCQEISCVYSRGKLYLVGDRHPHDVHVCDLSLPPPYVWTLGPPMRSAKHYPHLVAYNGLIFALSNPDYVNCYPPWEQNSVHPMSTFEVWDTNKNNSCWEVLPDPPLKDYNLTEGLYKVMSHTVLDGVLYFVFDYIDLPVSVVEEDGVTNRTRPRFRSTKVEAFDPKLRQWAPSNSTVVDEWAFDEDEDGGEVEDEEAHDMLSLYIDFSARRHEKGVKVVEFFENDPSLRMFLIDPTGGISLTPCFYTYDLSTFDPKAMLKAVRDFWPPSVSDMSSRQFLNWFQEFARPYLSSVVGLTSLLEVLKGQPRRNRHCFVLPSSYKQGCWTFCIVAFIEQGGGPRTTSVVVKFRLRMNSFHAEDIEMRIEHLPDTYGLHNVFSKIP